MNHQSTGAALTATPTIALLLALLCSAASAKSPCGDLGECKALVEINASDGDIGFHFLMDGDELTAGKVQRPDGRTLFRTEALRQLNEQTYTELFVESSEPLCFDPLTDDDPENDDEDFVTLADFLARWDAGAYRFVGFSDDGRAAGRSNLNFYLPAAPANLVYDDANGFISWDAGEDLGECADVETLSAMVANDDLPAHPRNVKVATWEIVFEPDVEDDHPASGMNYTVRVPGDIAPRRVKVPRSYRMALPDDTPVKFEVGAITKSDNATFSEEGDVCLNEVLGCEEAD